MTNQINRKISQRFNSYVDGYRDKRGALHPMLQLKLTHSSHVTKNARAIMRGERWPQEDFPTGEVAATLHDIGRFSQFADFKTFQDADSVDHARRGVEVIKKLDILNGATQETVDKILNAVRWHNRKAIPEGQERESAALAHLIRDADKLDIFRVMETAVKDGMIDENPEMTWDLDLKKAPNHKLVESILQGQAVDYGLITGLSDFILIQIGWIISGFHYRTALKMVKERNVIQFRREFLKTLSDDTAIDRCCDAAEETIQNSGRKRPY